MSAWLYQDDKQLKKVGPERASWYVGWLDPDGKRRCKSFGPGAERKKLAFRHRKKVEAELLTGTYQNTSRKTWAEFRKQYETAVLAGEAVRYREMTARALDHFERIINPVKMSGVTEIALSKFVAARRTEPGLKPNTTVSPATVN
jgi:hypothetical protein